MTNAIRLAAVTAFAMTVASGCGGGSACDDFADYLVDTCGIGGTGTATGDGADVECDEGTTAACQSECGLAADCSVFSTPDDPTDQAYLDAVAGYTDCITAC